MIYEMGLCFGTFGHLEAVAGNDGIGGEGTARPLSMLLMSVLGSNSK